VHENLTDFQNGNGKRLYMYEDWERETAPDFVLKVDEKYTLVW
jgi:hypothetical protein